MSKHIQASTGADSSQIDVPPVHMWLPRRSPRKSPHSHKVNRIREAASFRKSARARVLPRAGSAAAQARWSTIGTALLRPRGGGMSKSPQSPKLQSAGRSEADATTSERIELLRSRFYRDFLDLGPVLDELIRPSSL